MKTIHIAIGLLALLFFTDGNAQLVLKFQSGHGGLQNENAWDIVAAGDENYVLVGNTTSTGAGLQDVLVEKITKEGHVLWSKTIGGAQNEYACKIVGLPDGGFAVVGYTESIGMGSYDYYLIRLDSVGNQVFKTTYGTSQHDVVCLGFLTAIDGGFFLAGDSQGFSGNGSDFWVIKIDSLGSIIWDYVYDSGSWDVTHFLAKTSDNGVIVGGNYGTFIKLDSSGIEEWRKVYLGPVQWFHLISPLATDDGGIVFTGRTVDGDAYLWKISEQGDSLWMNTYGGSNAEWGFDVLEMEDGGLLLVAETESFGAGGSEVYLVRTDEAGNEIWSQTFGGISEERVRSVIRCSDKEFLGVGRTKSFGNQNGFWDIYLLSFTEVEGNSTIEGRAYVDHNNNCVFDTLVDEPIPNRLLRIDPGPYLTYTDSLGLYSFRVDPGNYIISEDTTDNFPAQPCGQDTFHVLAGLGSNGPYDFPLVSSQDSCNLNIDLVSAPLNFDTCIGGGVFMSPCPGKFFQYCFTIHNEGGTFVPNIDLNDSVVVMLPSGMSYQLQVGGCMQLSDIRSDSVIFKFNSSITTGDTCQVCFIVFVDSGATNIGSTSVLYSLEAACTNDSVALDSGSWYNGDSCACDPNDLAVMPQGCGAYGAIGQEETLSYLIRFENTGTGAAHYIVIKDSLDPNLDLSSLALINSSHGISGVQINPERELVFSFRGIELQPNEKGFVVFSVKLKPGLLDWTSVSNQAAIYFDHMPPVITNEVVNTVMDIPAPIVDFSFSHSTTNPGAVYNFTYSGTSDPSQIYSWDFGNNAIPSTSSSLNPGEVKFLSPGPHEVNLTVNRKGCVSVKSDSIWPESYIQGKHVMVCHQGTSQLVGLDMLLKHLDHGDSLGPCFSSKTGRQEAIVEGFWVSPNPFHDQVRLGFELDTSANVRLAVYDDLGREVELLLNSVIERGAHEVNFATKDLQTGVYFALLEVGGRQWVNKVLKE